VPEAMSNANFRNISMSPLIGIQSFTGFREGQEHPAERPTAGSRARDR
jgi:hypothetical protein